MDSSFCQGTDRKGRMKLAKRRIVNWQRYQT
jgi:hypothetical protein